MRWFWSSSASKNLTIEDKVGDSALYFNDPASPFMRAIIDLHDYVLIFLAWVLVFVVVILGAILYNNYYTNQAYNFDQTIQREIIGFKNNSIWYFRHLFDIMIEGSYFTYLRRFSIMLFYYPFVISLFLFSAYLSTRRFFYQLFFGNFINYYMINLDFNKIDFSDVYELEAWEQEWDYATTRVRSWMPKRFFSRYVLTWFSWIWRHRINYFKANVYGGITLRIVDDLENDGRNSNQYFRWIYDYVIFGFFAALWRWTSAYGSDITTRHWLNINFWYLYTGLILGKANYSIIKKYQKDDSNWNRVESATFYLILTRMLYAERNQQAIVEGFDFTHNDRIETIWTLFPSFILVLIAIPSLLVLFALDEIGKPVITVKAIGHQWYWSYEITVSSSTTTKTWAFDSYMIPTSELLEGHHRNLEVDNALYLPNNSHIRVLATSVDVLHSWAVPALGVKIDVVPGRLNQIGLFIDRPGVFFGQCSEICGTNHGFMPIQIISTNRSDKWLSLFADNVSWTSEQERIAFVDEVSTILPQPNTK